MSLLLEILLHLCLFWTILQRSYPSPTSRPAEENSDTLYQWRQGDFMALDGVKDKHPELPQHWLFLCEKPSLVRLSVYNVNKPWSELETKLEKGL